MKSSRTRANVFRPPLYCVALGLSLFASGAGATEYIGRLAQITTTKVVIENVGEFKIVQRTSQCFDHRGEKTTCATLAGVGYADKAKVTVIGDTVQRIDVLKLAQ